MNKLAIEPVVAQLIQHGEDSDELTFWLDIFDDLDPEDQSELVQNLTAELAALEKASQAKPSAPRTAPETPQTPSSAAPAQGQ